MLENVHTSFSSWAIAFEAHSTSSWKEAFTFSKATQNLMLQNRISVFSVFADFLENITAEYSIYYVIWQKKTFVIFAFLQGSYGIVKLAYNKDDDVQYVSKIDLSSNF